MFINSLLERFESRKIFVKGYADDIVIAETDIDKLQASLTSLANWCDENGMIVNVEKTKIVKFRKAGPIGKRKLYFQRKPVEFVPTFKYLGITMQPALGFSAHIDQLVVRTAAIVACLGDLRRIPLDLALKIYAIKIMPIIQYGLRCISKRIPRTSMQTLDRSKSLYLKAVLGLSNCTSNTYVLELADQRSLCEDLKGLGYEFQEATWTEYADIRRAKREEFHRKKFRDGPAFTSKGWTAENRSDRKFICRLTYHGYHHKICAKNDFFTDQDDDCACSYCGEQSITRLHLLQCTHFTRQSLTGRIREILTNCQERAK